MPGEGRTSAQGMTDSPPRVFMNYLVVATDGIASGDCPSGVFRGELPWSKKMRGNEFRGASGGGGVRWLAEALLTISTTVVRADAAGKKKLCV